MLFIDEADEKVSSIDSDETIVERACYPSGAGRITTRLLMETESDDDVEERMALEMEEEETRETVKALCGVSDSTIAFEKCRLQVVPHIFLVTATPFPIFFTKHDKNFYMLSMDVAPNYIGYSTPDYRRNRIQHVPICVKRPSANAEILYPQDWWNIEKAVIERVFLDGIGRTIQRPC